MSADSTVQNPSLCEYISAPIRFCVFGKHVELARAILKDTPIILLDEPSSALDVYSEKKIHQALGKLMKEKIVIMVSHRRDAYDKFDHVIKIE